MILYIVLLVLIHVSITKFAETQYLYPNFKRLSSEDFESLLAYTNLYVPYSDFNPLSLYTWNALNENSYSILEGNLVVCVTDYLGEASLYSILGENNIDVCISTLLAAHNKLSFFFQTLCSNSSIKRPSLLWRIVIVLTMF